MVGRSSDKFKETEEFRHLSQENLREESLRLIDENDGDPPEKIILSRSSDYRDDLYIERTPTNTDSSPSVLLKSAHSSKTIDASDLENSRRNL